MKKIGILYSDEVFFGFVTIIFTENHSASYIETKHEISGSTVLLDTTDKETVMKYWLEKIDINDLKYYDITPYLPPMNEYVNMSEIKKP